MKVQFLIAGIWHDLDRVFFTSRNRQNGKAFIVHNNDHSSVYSIPVSFFKEHFKFQRETGTYLTTLKYGDIKQFREIWEHH